MDIMSLEILCCRITIGDADGENPMLINNAIELNEVHNLEITESYKKLIGTAKLTFPKGSVFKSTILGAITAEGEDATTLTTEIMQDGVLVEKRSSQHLIEPNTFKNGQRIQIQLGYNGNLKTMFEGYITGYNADSMFEIQCENMAYKLKLKQAPKFETPEKGTTVNDVMTGKYNLLKDTGFKLHSDTEKFKIEIGKIKITDNFTVADILHDWGKYKIYCFLKYDANSTDTMPSIAIGRPYSDSRNQPVFPNDGTTPYQIHYDYHVAKNDLKVLKTDPKFLAVQAKGLDTEEKFFEVTVRLNPEYDPSDANSVEFQTLNETQVNSKRQKLIGTLTAEGKSQKVDLSTYTVVPYVSPKMGTNFDELKAEAIDYFRNYNLNGITGSVEIFGDFGLSPAVQVELIDYRNPSKNGTYIVEEVKTSFGVNGYRQKITIPYKVKGTKTTYGYNR